MKNQSTTIIDTSKSESNFNFEIESKTRPEWIKAKRFSFSVKDETFAAATCKLIWSASILLCDPTKVSLQPGGIFGMNDSNFGNYTLYFARGIHGRLPEPIDKELVKKNILPLLDPATASLFLLLTSPACSTHEAVRLSSKDLRKITNSVSLSRAKSLRSLAMRARVINSLTVELHSWPAEGKLPAFTESPMRLFEVSCRVKIYGVWQYLEWLDLDHVNFEEVTVLDLLVRPGRWVKQFLSESRLQYTQVPKGIPFALVGWKRFHNRTANALIDLIFRSRAAGPRSISGREIAKVLSSLSDLEFEDLVDSPSDSFAMAKVFDSFLFHVNEFYEIRCSTAKFLGSTKLVFHDNGTVEYKDDASRRKKGYWDHYRRAEFRFALWSSPRTSSPPTLVSSIEDESDAGNPPIDEIRLALKTLGITQLMLARETGIPQGTWSKALRGDIAFSQRFVDSIQRSFPMLVSLFADSKGSL